ncbi:MAG TPA: hypothetical protein VE863_19350, partial [Pyrinomonadaceae bacterium]|nr:hypothetical protein [Pyrinomonadaceae bacterium]
IAERELSLKKRSRQNLFIMGLLVEVNSSRFQKINPLELVNMNRKQTWKASVACALLTSILCFFPARTRACGPFFTDAIFVFTKHPDPPFEQFATGKIGIVQATWARSYLFVAYRTFSGNSLSQAEAKSMLSLWNDRLNLAEDDSSEPPVMKDWLEARKRVPGAAAIAEQQTYRNREKPHEYEEFLNCQPDAFKSATAILDERIKKYGAESNQVSDWLTAQDMVFADCHDGSRIPESTHDSDSLVRADRAYQIAAANFYVTNYDQAKEQFDVIAKDNNSPYRVVAPYLAARAMLRKGSFADKPEDAVGPLSEAETRLNVLLKDPSLRMSHHAAGRLLNLVRVRLHPEEKAHELARLITKKDAAEDFKQSVWDYTYLLDKLIGENDEGKKPPVPAGMTSDDLTDWIIAIQNADQSIALHSLERWQKTKSMPWLVAALLSADGKDGKANELLNAGAGVSSNSPAYPSIAFHRIRLLNEAGRVDEARTALDQVLNGDRKVMPASAVNLFLSERMMVAKNLDQFLQDAQREAAGFSDNDDGREIPADPKEAEQTANGAKSFFDIDAANIFNKVMPAAMMKDAARSKMLAPNLRKDVAQAAFARAALVDDYQSATEAANVMLEYYPQMKEFVTAYQRAATPDSRRFAAAFLSLKFPGVRPFVSAGVGRTTPVDSMDSYRDNYWCTEPPVPQAIPLSDEDPQEANKKRPLVAPDFLKASQSLGARQLAALQALGTAPNYLCKMAIDWTEKNPNDPRSPEALHLAVRSTRYGCTDKETGRWSKAAFDLLHKRYPNTRWAAATKYWFNG